MSHSCTSDIVPFVAHCLWEGNMGDNNVFWKLADPECWAEENVLDEAISKASGGLSDLDMGFAHGWTWHDTVDFGKRKRLYAHHWQKGDFHVYIINESQYSNGGHYEVSACGNDRASVEEFVKDLAPYRMNNFGIEETDSVEQWG